jgi:hypothetical protein
MTPQLADEQREALVETADNGPVTVIDAASGHSPFVVRYRQNSQPFTLRPTTRFAAADGESNSFVPSLMLPLGRSRAR